MESRLGLLLGRCVRSPARLAKPAHQLPREEDLMHTCIRWVVVVSVLMQLSLERGAAAADATPAPATPSGELTAVDAFFVNAYQRGANSVLADGPPAFLVLPARLVLYRRGARQEWPLLPPLFNELKTVAHVSLGLFAVLSPSDGGPLSAADVAALRRYQELIGVTRAAIDHVSLSADQRARQMQILSASQALAARALADGHLSAADLTAFCRQLRPLIDANIDEAMRAYLNELNLRMTAALPQLDAAERTSFLVIVSGVHQARIDNAAMQYFNRLMHDPPVITQRLMYAEDVFDESGALRLLAGHRLDRRVGVAYFDDPYYMNRDIFAPATEAYLPTMTLPEVAEHQ
jgi:hypothetical protein